MCLNAFSNCREEGLCLTCYKPNSDYVLNIWACQDRSSDSILIILGDANSKDNITNVYNDIAYKNRKYFSNEEMHDAIDYIFYNMVFLYKKELLEQRNFEFNINKSLEDIEQIQIDAKELENGNYSELATYYDKNVNYSCDLIIKDGKMGLGYNKHNTDGKKIEQVLFEEVNINLDNDTKLMKTMQEQLDKFIENKYIKFNNKIHFNHLIKNDKKINI